MLSKRTFEKMRKKRRYAYVVCDTSSLESSVELLMRGSNVTAPVRARHSRHALEL